MTDTGPDEPVWLETEVALAIHDRQLAKHGGLQGLSDAIGFPLGNELVQPLLFYDLFQEPHD